MAKKRTYHRREASDDCEMSRIPLNSTYGKQNGTKSQLIPPCPEYVKFSTGMIASANITPAKP